MIGKKKEMQDQYEMTEAERKIIAYLEQGHSWNETCRDLHVSPTKISRAVKKRDGTYVPDDEKNDNSNFEKYSEMYKLFSEGKTSHEVAITLNLPMDYVQEHYVFYLKSVGLEGAVKLYNDEKYEGITTLQNIRWYMKKLGYTSDNLKSVEAFASYTYQVHTAGRNLASLNRECDEKFKEKLREIKEYQVWKDAIENVKDRCEEWSDKAEVKRKEHDNFVALIERLKRENPNATAYEAGVLGAKSVLNVHALLIRWAFEAVISEIRNNTLLYWYFLPRTRPVELCYDRNVDNGVEEGCRRTMLGLANAMYEKLIDDSLNRGGYSGIVL